MKSHLRQRSTARSSINRAMTSVDVRRRTSQYVRHQDARSSRSHQHRAVTVQLANTTTTTTTTSSSSLWDGRRWCVLSRCVQMDNDWWRQCTALIATSLNESSSASDTCKLCSLISAKLFIPTMLRSFWETNVTKSVIDVFPFIHDKHSAHLLNLFLTQSTCC